MLSSPNSAAVAEKAEKVSRRVAARHDHDLSNPGAAERLERIIDHRPIVDRKQMLVGNFRQRPQARCRGRRLRRRLSRGRHLALERAPPGFVGAVPVDRSGDAVFERDSRAPSERAQLCRVHGIAAIVSGTIRRRARRASPSIVRSLARARASAPDSFAAYRRKRCKRFRSRRARGRAGSRARDLRRIASREFADRRHRAGPDGRRSDS